MAIKTKKYKRGNVEVRAIKVTERNYVNLANEMNSKVATKTKPQKVMIVGAIRAMVKVLVGGDETNHRVIVKTPKGERVAHVGDFIVKHTPANDRVYYTVGKAERFEAEWKEVK